MRKRKKNPSDLNHCIAVQSKKCRKYVEKITKKHFSKESCLNKYINKTIIKFKILAIELKTTSYIFMLYKFLLLMLVSKTFINFISKINCHMCFYVALDAQATADLGKV